MATQETATKLVLFDFDGTLYRSPLPPPGRGEDWWAHVYSLGAPEGPGYDPRWILSTVAELRRACLWDDTYVVILSARPDYPAMHKALADAVRKLDLRPHHVQLKPFGTSWSDAEYKASAVGQWLPRMPQVAHVHFYDDKVDNHAAVKPVVEALGRVYRGVLTPGWT